LGKPTVRLHVHTFPVLQTDVPVSSIGGQATFIPQSLFAGSPAPLQNI